MKASPVVMVVGATLIAIGTAYWIDARETEPRKAWPKPTPPPPPSPNYTPSKESAPTEKEIAENSREHNAQLALAVERALVGSAQQRETAFTFLLPELIQVEPQRLVAMVARQEAGETRDSLRNELARQWITRDRDAAIKWMKSLDPAEQRASARVAVSTLAAVAPELAIYVADEFGVGRDDGSLEHMVQIWAEADLAGAMRWLDSQPAAPRLDPLRARIEKVRAAREAREEHTR